MNNNNGSSASPDFGFRSTYGTKYSRMDQVKFVEDNLLKNMKWYGLPKRKQTISLQGYLPQILLGPVLNTLSHIALSNLILTYINDLFLKQNSGSRQINYLKANLVN